MKKATVIALILVGVIALGGGTIYAVGQIAKSNAITEETALNFAYVDAGVLPENAEVVSVEFEWEKGKFVYEIEFISEGIKYEYSVDSSTGKILKKETEQAPVQSVPAKQAEDPSSPAEGETNEPAQQPVSVEKAKETALKDAGVQATEVVFTKAKQETEHGRLIYDIEFYIPEKTEYEYEIDAYTGEILESGFEEQTKKSDPASTAEESETSGTEPSKQESQESQQISVDQAKTIALDHAGVPADQVIFSKAKLEHDDGCLIYDIEFYVDGSADYEYEIDAYSGAILEADSEPWDQTGDIYESDDIDDDDDAEEEDD